MAKSSGPQDFQKLMIFSRNICSNISRILGGCAPDRERGSGAPKGAMMAAAAQSLPRDLIKSISFLGLLRQIFDDFATSWLSILFCNCICGARKITLGPEGTCVKFTLCECFHRVGVCILVLVGGTGRGCLYISSAHTRWNLGSSELASLPTC